MHLSKVNFRIPMQIQQASPCGEIAQSTVVEDDSFIFDEFFQVKQI